MTATKGEPMAEAIDERSRELLEAPNFGHVATIGGDGTPHVAVVWVDTDGDHVLLNSAEGRVWPDNIRRDPRLSLTVVNPENPYEYVVIRGRVVEITHEGADDHINALSRKYLGKDEYPFRLPDEVRLLIRVKPERVSRHGS
jgi:PPOX class probable F420-dependent enzyme